MVLQRLWRSHGPLLLAVRPDLFSGLPAGGAGGAAAAAAAAAEGMGRAVLKRAPKGQPVAVGGPCVVVQVRLVKYWSNTGRVLIEYLLVKYWSNTRSNTGPVLVEKPPDAVKIRLAFGQILVNQRSHTGLSVIGRPGERERERERERGRGSSAPSDGLPRWHSR